jgi:hypothetical protein
MEDFEIIDEIELLVVFLYELVAWMFMMLMTRTKMSLRLIHLPRAKRPLFSLKFQSFKIIPPVSCLLCCSTCSAISATQSARAQKGGKRRG